jgi:glycosyltransferase involved in cell wall biosynthesis
MELLTGLPAVSVVVPCYNRAGLIGAAVETVLRQSLHDWELIVVDDGSIDHLEDALQPYRADRRIRYLRHPQNRGAAAARNTGLAAARGRFVAFLDSDDQWLETKLERQLEAVLAAADPDRVFCATQTIVPLSGTGYCVRPLRGAAPGASFAEFLYNDGGFAQSSSFFLSATLARKIRFREELLTMEDHMFFIEVGAAGAEYVLVPEPLVVWRNDTRIDRISRSLDLPARRLMFERFRQRVAHCVPPRALVACEARFFSPMLWRRAPGQSVALLLRARRSGALSTRQVAALFCHNALPGRIYDSIRFWCEPILRRSGMWAYGRRPPAA